MSEGNEGKQLRLNLGCGSRLLPPEQGWRNVDKYPGPGVDECLDLEREGWAASIPDSSVDEVALIHVLEHICPEHDQYRHLWQEIYRVCKHGAAVTVICPDPKCDDFLDDPTHIRAVTPRQFSLFSKRLCEEWKKAGAANSQLARYWGINFEVVGVEYAPTSLYLEKNPAKRDDRLWLGAKAAELWNQISQFTVTLQAVKA